jgi:hypothetical protein
MRTRHWPILVVISAALSFPPIAAPQDGQSENRSLAGTVVGPDGARVKNAVVRGFYVERGGGVADPIKLAGNAAGEFRLERKPIALWLYATSANGDLAGRAQAGALEDSITVRLAPAATVVGRLIENDAPVVGALVACTLFIRFPPDASGKVFGRAFPLATAMTATDGRFALSGLLVGERCEVRVENRDAGAKLDPQGTIVRRRPPLSTLTLQAPGKVDMGYLEVPLPWRVTLAGRGPQQEIDGEELATSRFDVKTKLETRISTSVADAKREYRSVMLVIADPKSPASRTLIALLEGLERADQPGPAMQFVAKVLRENSATGKDIPAAEVSAEFARPLAGFQRLCIDAGDEAAADYLTTHFKIDVRKLVLPVLVVLGEDGSPAELQSLGAIDDLQDLAIESLRDVLKRRNRTPSSAADQLAAALQRARKENKHVLLQECSAGSYPARLLTRFIDRHRLLFERDYVYVNIDSYRASHGAEVMEPLHKPAGKVPWMAILRSDGTKIADSDAPTGNIGFPAEPEAINYFIDKMLKPTAQRLTPSELDALRSELAGE